MNTSEADDRSLKGAYLRAANQYADAVEEDVERSVLASAAQIEALARLVWETERAVVLEWEAEHGRQPGSIPYAEHYEDEPAEFHQVCEAVAAAVLAAGFVRPEDVAEAQARAAQVFGWQHLVKYAGMSAEWMDATLSAVVAAALRPVDAPEGGASRG